MSKFYNPQRTRNLFDPNDDKPFKLSRSKIDLFLNCPRCFYLDRRLGVGRPPGYPFNLNSAVDSLLKKEFDVYRAANAPHPWMVENGIDAVPFDHPKMDDWRNSLSKGIDFLHESTNLIISGGIDDLWITPNNQLIIVDYKATSKSSEVNLDADWQIGYKRQMDLYGWLFRMNEFQIHHTGYFVYCNGRSDLPSFNSRLEFAVKLIPYALDFSWIELAVKGASECLKSVQVPSASKDCDYCQYVSGVNSKL